MLGTLELVTKKRRKANNEAITHEPQDIKLDVSSEAAIEATFPAGPLSDYQLYRILTSALPSRERAKKYPEDFDTKEYILETRIGKGMPALLTAGKKEYYAVICNTVQLHGEEKTNENLTVRREVKNS